MGPINIRYHVVSLAAVFLALGVGILVGSNTNFFGISSIIKSQNSIIEKLEENYKEIRKEVKETKAELNETEKYKKLLEDSVLPKLLSGKLDGLDLGVVVLGEPKDDTMNEDAFLGRLKTSGGRISFKVHTSLAVLKELLGKDPGLTVPLLAKEMLNGADFGTSFTDNLVSEGALVSGSFEKPVGGIVFILGSNLDLYDVRRIVLPIENVIENNEGLVLNAAYGRKSAYMNIFKAGRLPYFQNIEKLNGQVDAVSQLSELYLQRRSDTLK